MSRHNTKRTSKRKQKRINQQDFSRAYRVESSVDDNLQVDISERYFDDGDTFVDISVKLSPGEVYEVTLDNPTQVRTLYNKIGCYLRTRGTFRRNLAEEY